jgi:hypothetical protein
MNDFIVKLRSYDFSFFKSLFALCYLKSKGTEQLLMGEHLNKLNPNKIQIEYWVNRLFFLEKIKC